MIFFLFAVAAALVFAGAPIAYAIGVSALATFLVFLGHLPAEVVAQRVLGSVDKFTLIAIPLFILGGELMNTGGLTDRLVRLCRAMLGPIRGGLGLVTVGTGVFLAGISGSGTADAAGLAKTLIPAMRKQGYDEGLAASIVASAGALGPIIPPSIVMIIYASMTNISIGKLFLAGVVPGLLMGLAFMGLVVMFAFRFGYPREPWQGLRNLVSALLGAAGPLVAPAIILVGIIGGYFSATETGAILVLYALGLGFWYRELTWAKVFQSCIETAMSVGSILFIIALASVLGWILAVGGLPQQIGVLINTFIEQKSLVMLVIIAILLFLGCFLDGLAVMVILVPIFLPISTALGMDPIQFAMVIVLCIVVGGVTPPVGITLYVACQAGGVPFNKVHKTIWWFVGAMTAVALACAFVPALTTALPNAVFGS